MRADVKLDVEKYSVKEEESNNSSVPQIKQEQEPEAEPEDGAATKQPRKSRSNLLGTFFPYESTFLEVSSNLLKLL